MAVKRLRGRKNPPIITADVDIVLPKAGASVVLPPEAKPEAEHVIAAPEVKLPRAARKRATLEQLKLRAKKIKLRQRPVIKVWVTVSADIYEALVDLAEEYGLSMAEVHRQALSDGLRKFRDFRTPGMENPMHRARVLEQYPGLADAHGPRSGEMHSARVSQARRSVLADDLTSPVEELDELAVRRLGSFLPQSNPAPTSDSLAYDPLAPEPSDE